MVVLLLSQLILALRVVLSDYIHDVITETRDGAVKGRRRIENYHLPDAETDTVDEFLGIPYAKPPVGDLRFKPPEQPSRWETTRDCRQPGWVCPQWVWYTQTQKANQREDCLYLNIYSPVNAQLEDVLYPVMVYIHGGSYEEGAGSRYDGFCLAAQGVVIVTINYRLGFFGFLTTGDDQLPGNYGILDQIEALRWIRANIAYFRGDPSKVTLFGSSAGASSVGLLVLSPPAQGLFHQVIIQSGSPLSPWALYNQTTDHADFVKQVAAILECEQLTMTNMIHCLRHQVTHSDVIKLQDKFPRIVPSHLNFKPRVDGWILPDLPLTLLQQGAFPRIPSILGTVNDEWSRSAGWFYKDIDKSLADTTLLDGMEPGFFARSVRHVISSRFWWPESISDVIMHEYTDWQHKDDAFRTRKQYVEMMSDFLMVAPTVRFANYLSRRPLDGGEAAVPNGDTRGESPIYFYVYEEHSPHTNPDWWGAYHSIELEAVFGSPFTSYNLHLDTNITHYDREKNMSAMVIKMWTDFAKCGNPTPEGQPIIWDRYKPEDLNHIRLSTDTLQIENDLRRRQMSFWNDLLPSLMQDISCRRTPCDGATVLGIDQTLISWVFLTSTVFFFIAFILTAVKVVRSKPIPARV